MEQRICSLGHKWTIIDISGLSANISVYFVNHETSGYDISPLHHILYLPIQPICKFYLISAMSMSQLASLLKEWYYENLSRLRQKLATSLYFKNFPNWIRVSWTEIFEHHGYRIKLDLMIAATWYLYFKVPGIIAIFINDFSEVIASYLLFRFHCYR